MLAPWPRAGCRAPAPGTCAPVGLLRGSASVTRLLGFGVVSWGLGMAPDPGCADRKCVQLWGEWENPDRAHSFCLGRLPKENWSRSTAIPISAPYPLLHYSTLSQKQPPTDLSQHSFLPSLENLLYCLQFRTTGLYGGRKNSGDAVRRVRPLLWF